MAVCGCGFDRRTREFTFVKEDQERGCRRLEHLVVRLAAGFVCLQIRLQPQVLYKSLFVSFLACSISNTFSFFERDGTEKLQSSMLRTLKTASVI